MKYNLATLTFFACCFSSHAALTVVDSTTHVGPNTTITATVDTSFFETGGTVFFDFDTASFTVDDSATRSTVGYVKKEDSGFAEDRTFFREAEAASVPDPAGTRSGVSGSSNMFIGQTTSEFHRTNRVGSTTGYLRGAVFGTDNWVYFSKNDNLGTEQPSFWVQIDITETTATPVRYVHDPATPFADITMADAINATQVPEPSSSALFGLGGLLMLLRRR
ncbi:MAG: PEP-CTERM sorting domain-containing protein [Akkermansiaceae bacterium]